MVYPSGRRRGEKPLDFYTFWKEHICLNWETQSLILHLWMKTTSGTIQHPTEEPPNRSQLMGEPPGMITQHLWFHVLQSGIPLCVYDDKEDFLFLLSNSLSWNIRKSFFHLVLKPWFQVIRKWMQSENSDHGEKKQQLSKLPIASCCCCPVGQHLPRFGVWDKLG